MFRKIKIIVKNDLLALFRNDKFKIILFSFFLILGLALYLSYVDYKNISENTSKIQDKLRTNWVNQNKKNPHSAGHFGTFLLKEATPFLMVDKGLYSYLGQIIRVETHKQNAPKFRQCDDTNYLSRQGELTIGFILQIFIPLFIIIISYDSITKEKENETIRLVLCQGVKGKEVLISKFLTILIVLSILIAPFFLAIAGLLAINTKVDYIFLEALIFFLSYIIYFIVFISIAVGISARCSTSRKSLILLFSIWVVMIILIPKFSTFISEEFNPTYSSYDFTEEIEKKYYSSSYESVNKTSDTRKKVMRELLKEYKVSTLDSIPFNFFGYFLQFTENQGTKIYNESYARVNDIFKSQNKVHKKLSFLSPLINLRSISMALSSTNIQEQFNFINTSEAYRQNMMSILNNDIMHNAGNGVYLGDQELWNKVPEYEYCTRSLTQRLNDCKTNIVILIVWFMSALFFLRGSVKYINR